MGFTSATQASKTRWALTKEFKPKEYEGFKVIGVDVLELDTQLVAPGVQLLDAHDHAEGHQGADIGILDRAEVVLITAPARNAELQLEEGAQGVGPG